MSHAPSVARRADAALVIVDVQERLAAAMDRRESVLASVDRLVRVAALTGVPIIVTRQYPKGLGDVEPALRSSIESVAEQTSVAWVDKLAFDCFAEPVFAEKIGSTGRRQILLAGMESHICIAQTALAGLRADYDIHVVADACCSRHADDHALALARLRAAGATVTGTESVLYELVGVAGNEEFRELLRIVKG